MRIDMVPCRVGRKGAGRRRFRLLIRAPRGFDLAAYLREWLAAAPKKHGAIKLDIDVEPQSFLCWLIIGYNRRGHSVVDTTSRKC